MLYLPRMCVSGLTEGAFWEGWSLADQSGETGSFNSAVILTILSSFSPADVHSQNSFCPDWCLEFEALALARCIILQDGLRMYWNCKDGQKLMVWLCPDWGLHQQLLLWNWTILIKSTEPLPVGYESSPTIQYSSALLSSCNKTKCDSWHKKNVQMYPSKCIFDHM
jgi:hypothetical protein